MNYLYVHHPPNEAATKPGYDVCILAHKALGRPVQPCGAFTFRDVSSPIQPRCDIKPLSEPKGQGAGMKERHIGEQENMFYIEDEGSKINGESHSRMPEASYHCFLMFVTLSMGLKTHRSAAIIYGLGHLQVVDSNRQARNVSKTLQLRHRSCPPGTQHFLHAPCSDATGQKGELLTGMQKYEGPSQTCTCPLSQVPPSLEDPLLCHHPYLHLAST